MIFLNDPCDRCIHMREDMAKDNKYKPTCDAFPEGIPYVFLRKNNVKKIEECNNGIGFEEKKVEEKFNLSKDEAVEAVNKYYK